MQFAGAMLQGAHPPSVPLLAPRTAHQALWRRARQASPRLLAFVPSNTGQGFTSSIRAPNQLLPRRTHERIGERRKGRQGLHRSGDGLDGGMPRWQKWRKRCLQFYT